MQTLVLVLDLVGTFVFAASDAAKGIGGMVRDMLLAEVGYLGELPPTGVTIAGAVLCFGLRVAAIRHAWHLPTAQPPQADR